MTSRPRVSAAAQDAEQLPGGEPARLGVRRFEQISGRSLASTESLAEVWLALRTTAAVPDAAPRPAPA